MRKLLMMIPSYKKHQEKKAMDKAKADFLADKKKALRYIRGQTCYLKLMERLANRDIVRAAREKKERRKYRSTPKRFKKIGIIIDASAFEPGYIHQCEMAGGIPNYVFMPAQKEDDFKLGTIA